MHFEKIWDECVPVIRDRLQALIDLGVEIGEG
jgi:hypothetical protein